MAEQALRAPKGTNDILPPSSWSWQAVTSLALDVFARAGYAPIETPIFEHTEVFERGVGEASEVVGKQMYTFSDRAGRSLTLRPEGTAPVMRAVLEHGLERSALPVKLAYTGPMFRQERPQKGRHRQFFTAGIEAVGAESPLADAEVIEVGRRFLADAGVTTRLVLNSIGHPDPSCRGGYVKVLREFLEERRGELPAEDGARVDTNPLRLFDSKEDSTAEVMKGAPLISDHLCTACREHFEAVQTSLSDLDVDFDLDPRLVRGLDYYTRTAFEYMSPALGAKDSVGGGGRYDGLAESLGGPRLPGVGFGLGLDRIMLVRERVTDEVGPVEVYVVALGDQARSAALKLATRLRSAGIGTELDLAGRAMKGQMKDAARSHARWAVIVGEHELSRARATVKDLVSGEQREVAFADVEASLRS